MMRRPSRTDVILTVASASVEAVLLFRLLRKRWWG